MKSDQWLAAIGGPPITSADVVEHAFADTCPRGGDRLYLRSKYVTDAPTSLPPIRAVPDARAGTDPPWPLHSKVGSIRPQAFSVNSSNWYLGPYAQVMLVCVVLVVVPRKTRCSPASA